MNDILLGMIEIEAARKRGKDLWWERTGGVGDLGEFMEEAICRAQVAKVVDEWEKYVGSYECPNPERSERGDCEWDSCKVCRARHFMAALKAAGGEG